MFIIGTNCTLIGKNQKEKIMTTLTINAHLVFVTELSPITVLSIIDCTGKTLERLREIRDAELSSITIVDSEGRNTRQRNLYQITKLAVSECENHVVATVVDMY